MLFVGGKGVGKRSLAKECATLLFGSDESFFAINAEDYKSIYGVNRLIGTAGGDGGLLTEQIRRKPRCLLFFDNVNKADTELLSIIRRILEEGTVTDGNGLKISFKSCFVVLSICKESGTAACFTKAERTVDPITKELEALTDETAIFESAGEKELTAVAEACFEELKRSLMDKGIVLEKSDNFLPTFAAHWHTKGISHGDLRRQLKRYAAKMISEESKGKSAWKTILHFEEGKENNKITAKN